LRLNADQLQRHLDKELAPLYLISGDEPLLSMEAGDRIRQTARQQGYSEREVYHADAGFDWNEISLSSSSMSLFAEKKIIEIRLPNGKPGTVGGKVLAGLAQQPPPDTLIMLITGKLDATARKSKWYRTVESHGMCLQLWPVPAQQLPSWIEQRLTVAGISASREAIQLLSDRVEGNLLAADQEIKKLGMLINTTSIDVEDVLEVVADSARHNVFEFIDAALTQQTPKLSRMLGHIRAEGAQPPVVLWAMAREFRLLFGVADALRKNRNPEQAMDDHQVWKSRRAMLASAARRKQPGYWGGCLARCAKIDRMIKGIADGNPWDELLQLGFRMSR
ncbi:MAG: DNA polymerase III subunit delta, partial [Gammaproteobacteria bacterium]|nr:DNA polymerase III subunit delta [Gammaproteobacteria bacterium]